jgi:hypothetical protein
MPFSKAIRDNVLLAAARRCCVCHRYRGVLIEVHHIDPEAQGGKSDFDNAIALCFDCHAWSGHFFSGHPRGTAYSPTQLRRARDDWYSKVARGEMSTQVESEPGVLRVRYYLCRDDDVSAQILHGDLSLAPMSRALLARTPTTDAILPAFSSSVRTPRSFNTYRTIEAFRAAYPNARVQTTYPYADTSNPGYAFYSTIRRCSDEEVRSKILRSDAFSAFLAAHGAPLSDLAIAIGDRGDCGDGSIAESYRTRSMWLVLIAVTNVSQYGIQLNAISGLIDEDASYRPLLSKAQFGEWSLPGCEVAPDETVLAPIAVIAAAWRARREGGRGQND